MNISVIGGDLRTAILAEMYANEKNTIYTYGLEKYFEENLKKFNIIICKNLEEAIWNSEYIISGMPFTKDKINVNAPFASSEIKLEELKNVFLKQNNKKIFFAGGIPESLCDNIYNVELEKTQNQITRSV